MADRLASIRKQIVALEKRASELLRAENKKVIDRIKALIARHQLTAEDLGLGGAGGKAVVSADAPARKTRGGKRAAAGKKGGIQVGVPMYRDPKSGKTWTGRGKPPNWIVKAKDRTPFLIGSGSEAAEEAPAKAGRKAKAAKPAAKKPAAKKAAARKATANRAAKVPAAPKPPKAARKAAAKKGANKAASKRSAKGPGRTAPPPPAPAAAASTEA